MTTESRSLPDFARYLPDWAETRTALIRHGWKGAVVAFVLLLLVAAGVFSMPRQYASEAKLFVKVGRETLTLDPTATTGQLVSIYESRENEINSLLEVLRSRSILERVVDVLGPAAILRNGPLPPDVELAVRDTTASPASSDDRRYHAEREQAVSALERTLEVGSPKRTSIIILRMKASSPELAQAVLTAALAVFRDLHAKTSATAGSYEFFVAQEQVLKQRYETAAAELREAKNDLDVSTLEGKRAILQSQWSDVEQRLMTTASELAASEARIVSLRRNIAEQPLFTETLRAEAANAAGDNMRGSLYQLQIKEKELLARLTADHPAVTAVREQVAELQRVLADEKSMRVQATSGMNENRRQLELACLTEQANLESLKARQAALTLQQGHIRAELKRLNGGESRLMQLQNGVELAQQSYRETALRLEQARINKALEEDRISNVNVVQPAGLVNKAIGSKRKLLFGFGFVASLFAGVMSVVALGCLDRYAPTRTATGRIRLPVIAQLRSAFGRYSTT